jgi:PAS domain S-box-containing protein
MLNTILLILSLVSAIVVLFFARTTKYKPGSSSLLLFSVAVALAALANFYIYAAAPGYRALFFAIIYISIRLGYTAILTFAVQYTGHQAWLKPSNLGLLALEPVITQVLFWTNPASKYLATEINLQAASALASNNLWFLVNTLYSNSLLMIALGLLFWDFSVRPLVYRSQTRFILAGIAATLLINNSFSASNYLALQEWKIISLLATGLALMIGFLHTRIYDLTPIARERVVEYMSDGWIVLDTKNRVVDINAAAKKIFGASGMKLSGQPAEKIFIDWPNIMNNLSDTREHDLKGSVQIKNKWIYLNIHIAPLIDSASQRFGKLIVWRDITEHRLADEARQQARDDMFILLHSITSAASRALNLDDFLSETIYQIVYSSHSQTITVFLLEEHERSSHERFLVLAAQHGIPLALESKISSIPASLELVALVLEHGKPLLIPDIQTDARIPVAMQASGPMTLLLIPMQTEGKVLGFIGLTRVGISPYTTEEIARLTAVTDEVATFVNSNRQRQLSIALAERQRLVRDLHDSVTQQLYGLVILAEATKAGIQAGVIDMPARVIAQMADNARQALKEMRLFLFQMQPVDFEKDGLAVVLQHRLSAVEGRADINARLISDDIISLPMEKELALYFIAQEALNNVLKHAKAKNIIVSLLNKKANFILKVDDDGCGFDPHTIYAGGIGLKSMRERAEQIGGKLKISSAPGKGTKIAVTLRNNFTLGDV